ncbi:MAG: hypothetical protein ACI9U2_004351 [Bradymonadia bacterium]|jgi:hypothetical protein
MNRLLAVLLLSAPCLAQAEVRPSDINRPVGENGLGPGYGNYATQWALELGVFAGTETDAVSRFDVERLQITPMLRVATPAQRNDFEVVVGLVNHRRTFAATDTTDTAWRLTNLFVAYQWAWRSLPQQFRLGLGLTLPTAQLPRGNRFASQLALDAYRARALSVGWREYWLYRPEMLTFTGHVDYYWRGSSGLIVGGAAVAGLMLRASDSPDLPENEVVVQADLEIAYDTVYVRSALKGGVVALPVGDAVYVGEDTFQASIEPDFRIRLGGLDLLLRMTIPINKPAGFAFSNGGFWAVHVGIANSTDLKLPSAEPLEE